ncbi:hypothetical protein QBC37DRAFT_188680 [Rhypophila decipiens]|uniref:Uncharacterized protein n=1 Tax=Rhypophila decipiens TaxID=261697 RepID=A0AAN6YFT5_9PEZI|nr:hypothetical protein QBC37DRAFT_188680 [Rhypophila decipiens]
MDALVQRGHLKNPKSPRSYTSMTPPRIADNTMILAVTGPDLPLSSPSDDGWFISDFYAWNCILKGLGSHQTWLSLVTPQELVDEYVQFLHGNPYEPHKVVLSQDIIDTKKITEPTIVQSGKMVETFLTTLKAHIETANGRPILVLIFGHGQYSDCSIILEYEHYYDTEDADTYFQHQLNISAFEAVIQDAPDITLITNACYFGGWTISAGMHASTITAANRKTKSIAWPKEHEMTNGSIFTTAMISFLRDNEDVATDMASYNRMCSDILELMKRRVTRLWNKHKFTFSVEQDHWDRE